MSRAVLDDHLLRDLLADQVSDRLARVPADHEPATTNLYLMTLARQREADHPGDSIPVYESEVLAIINRKKPNQYRVAADLMDRIRRLAAKTGEPQRFHTLHQQVRTEHKAKRRLMAELDRMGWQAAATDDDRSP